MNLEEFRTKLYGMSGIATVEKAFELYSEVEKENERLKKEAAEYHQLQWQHDALIDENERLKAELKKWEDRSKVVKDGYDGEVYEWEDNYYIVTPHLNVFVKGLLREKARLRCLALHAMCEYFYAMYKRFLLIDRYRYYSIKYREAYCKAKKELK